jgi:hypothetical protein
MAAEGMVQAAAAAIGGALTAGLVVAVALCLWMRRRLWASESAIRMLRADADLDDSIALQRGEQELRWRDGDARPTASPGFNRLVGVAPGADDPLSAFLSILNADDAAAVRRGVAALRDEAAAFHRNVMTRDRRAAFAVHGTTLFAAGGASFAVLSVTDRSEDQAAIDRLERETA